MGNVAHVDFKRKVRVSGPVPKLVPPFARYLASEIGITLEPILFEDLRFFRGSPTNKLLVAKRAYAQAGRVEQFIETEFHLSETDANMQSHMRAYNKTSIASMCEMLMESDHEKWSGNPYYYGALALSYMRRCMQVVALHKKFTSHKY